MAQTPNELERDVEAARADVEGTLDALRSKMSFGQIVDELGGHVSGEQAQVMMGNIGRQVRDNPLALGLIGAGIAWLAAGSGVRGYAERWSEAEDEWDADPVRYRRQSEWPVAEPADPFGSDDSFERSGYEPGGYAAGSASEEHGKSFGDRLSETSEGVRSSLSSASDSVSDAASGIGNRIGDTATGAGERIGDAASGARRRVVGAAGRAADAAHHAGDRFRAGGRRGRRAAAEYGGRAQDLFMQTLQDQPLVLGALALAVGTAVGAALPPTRTEDEMFGAQRDKLRDDAAEALREGGEELGDVAARSYEAAKNEAKAEGLTRDKTSTDKPLADKVENVARTAADTAKSEAEKRADAAREGGSTST